MIRIGRLPRAGWQPAVPGLGEITDILLFGWRLDALRAHRLGFEGAQEYRPRVFLPGGKSAFVCGAFEQLCRRCEKFEEGETTIDLFMTASA